MKFREIRTSERITDNTVKKENDEYKKIKPVSFTTLEEAKKFMDDLFSNRD